MTSIQQQAEIVMTLSLRGMTWDHPRGLSPLRAAAARWLADTGVEIVWEARSLQAFETHSVEDLAKQYDLIVIDHPHVGQVSESGALVPLDTLIDAATLDAIASGSLGGSYESYNWAGRQWALPIDAAAQVQAWVPGRIAAAAARVDDLPSLLAASTALIPLRAPHSLMTLFTLCGLAGVTLDVAAADLFPAEAAIAYDRMATLVALVDRVAWSMDPIAVLEAMAEPDSTVAVAPFIYGYVSYAQSGFREKTVHFADLPTIGDAPAGSALGGTGIAVSRLGDNAEAAARFAAWVAGGAVQRELVGQSGGQPAHRLAWDDATLNETTHDFYRATRRTLDHAWLRPRHDGYMAFQQAASDRLEQALRDGEPAREALAALNRLYGELR